MVLQAVAAAKTPGASIWHDVVSSTFDGLRTLVILLVGIAGYVKFLRSRGHHATLDPDIEPELVEVQGAPAMRVTATIKNTGTCRMIFPVTCSQLVRIECVDLATWNAALTQDEIDWSKASSKEVDLLRRNGVKYADEALEPEESVVRCRLLPIPPGAWVAYRVTLD